MSIRCKAVWRVVQQYTAYTTERCLMHGAIILQGCKALPPTALPHSAPPCSSPTSAPTLVCTTYPCSCRASCRLTSPRSRRCRLQQ